MRLRYLASNTAGVRPSRPSTSASRFPLSSSNDSNDSKSQMIQSYITHFRITGHGFLLKILLRDIKSVSVNKSSVTKIKSQPRNFATNSIQSSGHFSGQNCPTVSACKIVNFVLAISNFGIVHFKRYILQLCKKKFGFICNSNSRSDLTTRSVKLLAHMRNTSNIVNMIKT